MSWSHAAAQRPPGTPPAATPPAAAPADSCAAYPAQAASLYVLPHPPRRALEGRVAGAVLLAEHLAVPAWGWPRVAPLVGPSPHPGSARAAADAWRHPRVRFALAALAALWLAVDVGDRLNDP